MHTVSVVKGKTSPQEMLNEALDLIGNIQTLIPDRQEKVLIKPNFGCHKMAFTGATTDLRVLVALIKRLKKEGYSNVVVGDGGMAGYLKVDILNYLGVPALCRKYNVTVLDLNRDEGVLTELPTGCKVKVSKTALESKVIDLAKLKTHVLATVTLGTKNLLGCVVGSDKREIHLKGLHENLGSLPSIIKPKLTIIEGIVGMEGRGPVGGKPKESNILIASADVVAADLVASKLMGFDPFQVTHLNHAIRISTLPYDWKDIQVKGKSIAEALVHFEPAVPINLEANPFMNRLKHMIRGGPLHPIATTLLSSSSAVSSLVKRLGILQEEINYQSSVGFPSINKALCKACGTCVNSCPANALSIAGGRAELLEAKCLRCHCCVETCPTNAIAL